jgi:hypothetical protein
VRTTRVWNNLHQVRLKVHAIARTTLKTSGSPEWWEVPFYFLYMFLIGNKPVVNCDKKLV